MSGQSPHRSELMHWGYIALISIALAATSITTVSANTNERDDRPASARDKLEACVLPADGSSSQRGPSCDWEPQANTSAEFETTLRSAAEQNQH